MAVNNLVPQKTDIEQTVEEWNSKSASGKKKYFEESLINAYNLSGYLKLYDSLPKVDEKALIQIQTDIVFDAFNKLGASTQMLNGKRSELVIYTTKWKTGSKTGNVTKPQSASKRRAMFERLVKQLITRKYCVDYDIEYYKQLQSNEDKQVYVELCLKEASAKVIPCAIPDNVAEIMANDGQAAQRYVKLQFQIDTNVRAVTENGTTSPWSKTVKERPTQRKFISDYDQDYNMRFINMALQQWWAQTSLGVICQYVTQQINTASCFEKSREHVTEFAERYGIEKTDKEQETERITRGIRNINQFVNVLIDQLKSKIDTVATVKVSTGWTANSRATSNPDLMAPILYCVIPQLLRKHSNCSKSTSAIVISIKLKFARWTSPDASSISLPIMMV